jgi:hypothetical protein
MNMKETDLERFIQEATNKAKSRDLDFKHKLAICGKVYANIASFALLTPSSNDKNVIDDFTRKLTDSTVMAATVKDMNSQGKLACCLFNEKFESVAKFAGRLGLPDLFFCHTSDEGLVCEFWRKEQADRPYDQTLNPYLLISKTITWEHDCNAPNDYMAIADNFRYVVDISVFDRVNEELEAGIQRVVKKFNRLNSEDVLPFAFNHVGQFPATCKRILIG